MDIMKKVAMATNSCHKKKITSQIKFTVIKYSRSIAKRSKCEQSRLCFQNTL